MATGCCNKQQRWCASPLCVKYVDNQSADEQPDSAGMRPHFVIPKRRIPNDLGRNAEYTLLIDAHTMWENESKRQSFSSKNGFKIKHNGESIRTVKQMTLKNVRLTDQRIRFKCSRLNCEMRLRLKSVRQIRARINNTYV